MSDYKGDEIVLYTYEDLKPIGCEESCIINITANEIITTTKGSGRATNREYGSYDWNIQSNGVIGALDVNKTSPLGFGYDIIKGKKIIVKVSIRNSYYFGVGILTSCTYTGTSGEFAKYDVTIVGDGELVVTGDLINNKNEPQIITALLPEFAGSGFSIYVDTNLINATIILISYKLQPTDIWQELSPSDYTFDDNTGTIDVDENAILLPIFMKIFYIPA